MWPRVIARTGMIWWTDPDEGIDSDEEEKGEEEDGE